MNSTGSGVSGRRGRSEITSVAGSVACVLGLVLGVQVHAWEPYTGGRSIADPGSFRAGEASPYLNEPSYATPRGTGSDAWGWADGGYPDNSGASYPRDGYRQAPDVGLPANGSAWSPPSEYPGSSFDDNTGRYYWREPADNDVGDAPGWNAPGSRSRYGRDAPTEGYRFRGDSAPQPASVTPYWGDGGRGMGGDISTFRFRDDERLGSGATGQDAPSGYRFRPLDPEPVQGRGIEQGAREDTLWPW